MPSENYRYYCLDGTGHLHETQWISAQSDEEAITQVTTKHPDSRWEIWMGKRLVAHIGCAATYDVNPLRHSSLARTSEASRNVRKVGVSPYATTSFEVSR